jgi:hypothetical protein
MPRRPGDQPDGEKAGPLRSPLTAWPRERAVGRAGRRRAAAPAGGDPASAARKTCGIQVLYGQSLPTRTRPPDPPLPGCVRASYPQGRHSANKDLYGGSLPARRSSDPADRSEQAEGTGQKAGFGATGQPAKPEPGGDQPASPAVRHRTAWNAGSAPSQASRPLSVADRSDTASKACSTSVYSSLCTSSFFIPQGR